MSGVYFCQKCQQDHPWSVHRIDPFGHPIFTVKIEKAPEDSKFVSEVPKEAGDLVGTCVYNGKLIVACQYGIFQLIDGVLVQIKFKW